MNTRPDYEYMTRINRGRDCKFPLEPASRIYVELAIFFFAMAILTGIFL